MNRPDRGGAGRVEPPPWPVQSAGRTCCRSNPKQKQAPAAGASTPAIAAAGKAATVVQFTATPPEEEFLLRPHDLYFNETRLVPSYSCGPDDTRQALELVRLGVLNARELITHRFPLTHIGEAYEQAQKPDSLKVVVMFA